LQLKYASDPRWRKLKWKWQKGIAALTQASFGDPVNGNSSYTACLYDQTGGAPMLKMGVTIAGGGVCGDRPCWKKVGSSGWVYKDQTGGVTKLLLLGGAAGTPSVQLRSKGTGLPLPAPLNGSTYFDQDTEVILQLHSSNPVDCWSSSFVAVNTSKNDGSQFKAKSP
jgi:hypothetical protein